LLQVSYKPSWDRNVADQVTNRYNPITFQYNTLDTNLSNKFNNNIFTNSGGLAYRFNQKKYNFNFGLDYQVLELSSKSVYPKTFEVNKKFNTFLPNARYEYKFENKSAIRFFYRTQTQTPNMVQLQNVINNTNPLAIVTGNPNLVQQYNHFVMTRYNISNLEKGRTFFLFMGGGGTANYIANSSLVAKKDTLLAQGISLNKGSQLSKPVNLSGYRNFRSFMNYSMPIKFIKCNLNLNGGFSYTATPGLVNEVKNKINNYNFNSTVGIGSNISTKADFYISYSPNYTIVSNSLQPQLNSNFFTSSTNLKGNLMPYKGLVLTSDITNTIFTGLGENFNQNFWLWNAGIGYKFLKSQQAELRLTVFDLLNQNNSSGRTVTEIYTEDNRTQVLRRFYMLTFTYNIKHFPNKKAE
jgi:hypothetical protein